MSIERKEIHRDHNGLALDSVVTEEFSLGHLYQATCVGFDGHEGKIVCQLEFQNGPVKANGVNGFTNEALLAACIHRTEVLDSQYPCAENKLAIDKMKEALEAFESRTRDRLARAVEGEHKL